MARLSETEKAARQATAQHIREVVEKLHGDVRSIWRTRLNQQSQRANAEKVQAQIGALEHALRVLGSADGSGDEEQP